MTPGKNVASAHVDDEKINTDQSNVFKCDQCSKTFKLKKYLSHHIKYVHLKHKREPRLKCELCLKKLNSYQTLENHINGHLGLKPYKCRVCSKRFVKKGQMENHMQTLHPTEPRLRKWKCTKCEKSYFQKCNLHVHFKSAHEGVRYSCPTCSAPFSNKICLERHQLIHSGDLPFECKQCPKKFRQAAHLNDHVRRLHVGDSAKPHLCSYCLRTFFTRTELKRHLVVHTKDRPHSCTLCSKPFGLRINLQNHMRTHTLEKPFKCINCPTAFTTGSNLQQHQRRKHDSSRTSFTCVFCNLKCATNFRLKDHYFRHVQEKPYSCRRCDRSFCSKAELKKHSRKHGTINTTV